MRPVNESERRKVLERRLSGMLNDFRGAVVEMVQEHGFEAEPDWSVFAILSEFVDPDEVTY